MPTTLRFALAAVLTAAIAGCDAAALTAAPGSRAAIHGIAGNESAAAPALGGAPTGGAAGQNAAGKGADAPGSVPAPASSSAPSGSSTATNPTAGIGLSTFFDTYNFHFPVPAGQALGTVANSSQKLVASAGGHVYLQIGLQTIDKAPTTQRPPLNVSFVFDHSGSMYGEKIQYTRMAADHFVDQLGDQDLFSLVDFDSTVDTLVAPGFVTDKDSIKLRIDGLTPGSATNLDGGLTEGYNNVTKNLKQEKINRVVLMTDGQANVGETDPDVLAQRAANFAEQGVTLTTIGVGLDFDGDFLKKLADAGKGSYYYVNSEQDALNAFVGEAQALERTVAKGVKLNIQLADGVKLVQVFGHTAKTVGQSLNVDSNDLITGQSKVILLELDVPAGTAGSSHDLASVAVDYDDVPFGGHKQATATSSVTYSDDTAAIKSGTNGQIASSVIVLQSTAVLLRAVDLLDQGNPEQARQELATQYELVSAKATELGDADLQNDAADIKQYMDRIGTGDQDALKKEIQFDAFNQQQGKKKVVGQASPAPAATASPAAGVVNAYRL